MTTPTPESVKAPSTILFVCPDCKRQLPVARDDIDPPVAVKAVLQCDRCDDGDRHSPEYFNRYDQWVHPTAHLGASHG